MAQFFAGCVWGAMTDGLLEEIILLEKQIQQQLATEEERVARWRAGELSALDKLLNSARQATVNSNDEALTSASEEAERKARQLVAAAENWSRSLLSLDDESLRRVLVKHLAMIIPEVSDDHPHGQS